MRSATLDELAEDFELFDTRRERLEYLTELGREVEGLPEEAKIRENEVKGCVSKVWMVSEVQEGDPPVIHIRADSDSLLVRGQIAILLMLCSGRTADDIRAMGLEKVFQRLKLAETSHALRSNGFHQMVKKIKRLAEEHVDA